MNPDEPSGLASPLSAAPAPRDWSWAAIAALTLLAAGLWCVSGSYATFVLALVAFNVIVCVGLNILVGLSGQMSFGHVGFFAIGAYAAAILLRGGHSFWLALPASGALAAAVGALLAMPALRVAGPYLAMMTIAFGFIVENGLIEWKGLTGGSNGIMGFDGPSLFGRSLSEGDMALMAVALAGAALFFFRALTGSRWGKAMCAVRDSETAAQSLGLNPVAVKTVSFSLSALLTGVAGAVFAPLVMFVSPDSFPLHQSILFLLAVIVGGAGTLFGPVVGAAVVVLLPELLSGLAEYRLLIFGALLIFVLLAAPRGVIGTIAALAGGRKRQRGVRGAAGAGLSPGLERKERAELTVSAIGISFGGVQAAQEVTFTARPGQVTSIIGPNGAGKTTVLNMVSGFYRPSAGTVRLKEDLTGLPAWKTARLGVTRTYQTTLLFEGMSVLDNMLVALCGGRLGWLLAPLETRELTARAASLLDFVGYTGSLDAGAGSLAHVDKRLVEIARALACAPDVLLLDEPAAGLMRADKERLSGLLREIAGLGVAVVLVEHDMSLVMGISDHMLALDAGRPILEGAPSEVRGDPRVLEAYLGGADFKGRPRASAWSNEMVAVLATGRLSAGYGAAPVLEDVSIAVYPGEMVAVLGANGAGKTTLMRAICGLHRPVEGTVVLNDTPVGQEEAHVIARAGLALVPEGRQIFPELTVMDNLLLGAYRLDGSSAREDAEALLKRFPRLRERLTRRGGVLSGGEQQMLAIARGLMSRPDILVLDEPSLGLAPAMINELYDILADLRDEGVTILIVDQMANLALAVADRGYVLESGRVVHSGPASELRSDKSIEQAYLGGGRP